MPRTPLRWVFDELPPSGARRGGQVAEHAFGHGLGQFVREVCQNANDQESTRVDFELVELEGDALAELLGALRWPELHRHLAGAGETQTPSGRRLREFLTTMEPERRLLLLRIEDRGLMGLTGEEDGERSHFRALCKDTLFSVKASEDAGGSYGLGKSVLWTFSGLSTVLFTSALSELPRGRRSPRVIGRAELPYHAVDGEGFMGPGWFGREVEVPGGLRAESVWGKRASALAERLGMSRAHEDPGTTMLILGFREPAREQVQSPAQIASELAYEAARWFWPAMEADFRGLELRVSGSGATEVRAEGHAEFAPFVDAWRRRHEAKTGAEAKLERPGDLARIPLSVELPRPRNGTRRTRGEVELLVRLAEEDAPMSRRLATFRGAGMVVEYRDFSGLSGLRPFHAILACGRGRAPGAASDEDRMIDRFLRDAEPPGHDAWEVTPTIKDNWLRGSGQVFVHLWGSVHTALRQLLMPPVQAGVEGPERLRKRFPLGRAGRASSASRDLFALRDFEASLVDEAWRFYGSVTTELDAQPWRVEFSLHHLAEDGSHARDLAIESLETEPPLPLTQRGEAVEVTVPLGVSAFALAGRSIPVEDELRYTEIGLRVVGEQGDPG
ncbi:hypothetical protein G6O69_18535 [Pseudenhygromyxa sp. WMMC2535]|uniref:hypothetical protein n=1 Tax=Pseudenhygromyxa sp. WMMC2535 TaxID=2712867 RepID=UPI001553367B|nr:hypothetical protein [Pseudenhygromyxa sp. WMMC2535]NVB39847.1 hypothetical protein [Pseudenhygromyxa sp. WMMC2535]